MSLERLPLFIPCIAGCLIKYLEIFEMPFEKIFVQKLKNKYVVVRNSYSPSQKKERQAGGTEDSNTIRNVAKRNSSCTSY